MFISKSNVQNMINQIVGHKDYSTRGHDYDDQQDIELIKQLGKYITNAKDFLYIPDDVEKWIKGSVLEDILIGQNRPLHYLCSDCRYPKWCLTLDEAKEQYDNEYVNKNIRSDGFVNISGACPKCGD